MLDLLYGQALFSVTFSQSQFKLLNLTQVFLKTEFVFASVVKYTFAFCVRDWVKKVQYEY